MADEPSCSRRRGREGRARSVDRDLLGVRRILRDRKAEAEDAIAIPVEERVEREHVALARGIDELTIGAVVFGLRRSLRSRWLGHISSGR